MENVEKLEHQHQVNLAYEINDTTGFAEGVPFDSADEVREYFRLETLSHCAPGMEFPPQETLDEWSEFIIEHRLHCKF